MPKSFTIERRAAKGRRAPRTVDERLERIDLALELQKAGLDVEAISRKLKVSTQTIGQYLSNAPRVITQAEIDAMIERDRLAAMPDPRSLTGKVCGDPLPGRSALDQKART